jgi:hypothetical protein
MKKRTYVDKPLGDTEWLLEQWGWLADGWYGRAPVRLAIDHRGGSWWWLPSTP